MPSSPAVLRARAITRIAHADAISLPAFASHVLGAIAPAGVIETELLVGAQAQRVMLLREGKPATTLVYRGGDATLWDHALEAWTRVEGQPRSPISPARQLKLEKARKGDTTEFTLTMDDPALGRMRTVMVFSRDPKLREFGPYLFRALHCGALCHARSRLPYEELAEAGCLVGERTWFGDGKEPDVELTVSALEIASLDERHFEPPEGYVPLTERLRDVDRYGRPPKGEERPEAGEPDGENAAEEAAAAEAKSAPFVASRAFKAKLDDFTPDCVGSTRAAPLVATIRQDLLDHARFLVNGAAPLVGTATFGSGRATVPWLAALGGLGSLARGSGLFMLLREPRIPSAPPLAASGGRGLLDRLAWRDLSEPVRGELTLTEALFDEDPGFLFAWLSALGIPGPLRNAAMLAEGRLQDLSLNSRIAIVEAYEIGRGTITLDVPSSQGPTEIAGLVNSTVSNIAGSVSFGSLGTRNILRRLSIGNDADIQLNLTFPDITLTAAVAHGTTAAGTAVLVAASLGTCIGFPLLCPIIAITAATVAFMVNNVVDVAANATDVRPDFLVKFEWDSGARRVQPTVSLVERTGKVTITTRWVTLNLLGNLVDEMVVQFGNLFDSWLGAVCDEIAKRLTTALRNNLSFPADSDRSGLRAIDGDAASSSRALLVLSAHVEPVDTVSPPVTTQVARRDQVERHLVDLHERMRRDANPQPTPPTVPDTITVGTYIGIGLSQNALNAYVHERWVRGTFQRRLTRARDVARIVSLIPQGSFPVGLPNRVHLWCGSAPRVEVALPAIVAGTRPLVAHFDDVRACFEVVNGKEKVLMRWELSFSARTACTVAPSLPFAFDVRFDVAGRDITLGDPRGWEIVDTQVHDIMARLAGFDLTPVAGLLLRELLENSSAADIVAPAAVAAWSRTLPAMQQTLALTSSNDLGGATGNTVNLGSQNLYLEVLARQRTLYLLQGLQSPVFELVDGSGAPTVNGLLATLGLARAAPETIFTLNATQGVALLPLLAPLLDDAGFATIP